MWSWRRFWMRRGSLQRRGRRLRSEKAENNAPPSDATARLDPTGWSLSTHRSRLSLKGRKTFTALVFLDRRKLKERTLRGFHARKERELALGLNKLVFQGFQLVTIGGFDLDCTCQMAVDN